MFLKRLFDIFASFFGLLVLCPIILFVAFLIKTNTGKGPVFFIQQRVGRHGIPFNIIKFRTMQVNHCGSNISVKGEKRITHLGAILRKYKLDELPALWNVLKGDMSFVGPRPDVPGYADKLTGEERKILDLRPGITGPASIKYSNEEEILSEQDDPVNYNDEVIWPDKIHINMKYLKKHNFFLDIKIIIYTLLNKKLDF